MKNKSTKIILLVVTILLITISAFLYFYFNPKEKEPIDIIDTSYEIEFAITKNNSIIYTLEDTNLKKAGTISKNVELTIEKTKVTNQTKYVEITNLDQPYYINIKDISKTDEITSKDNRYQKYLLFNENVITKTTKLYKNDLLIYTLDHSMEFPIYIKDQNKYYVEYNNELMYILKEDIDKTITKENNKEAIATEIPVIVYHFIYDPTKEKCDQIICHSKTQFESHMNYIKENNHFTPTMQEFEYYMDGKINLPKKSVLITIDDGWLANLGSQILTEKELNGTIFLITGHGYKPETFETKYVETHSHSHNMHNQGACPTGQGGGIQCLPKDTILEDLNTSSQILNGSKYFCYPFYEYNDYSISVLKEAGYKMAFGGSYAGGSYKARVGKDKYQIPRYTLISTSSVEYLASILN